MAEAAPDPLKGPRREGRPPSIRGYEIGVVLGRGATGTVYRARQLAVDRDVAVKVLHAELSNRPRIVQRLQREARTSARLAHPCLVAAIDMGEVGGRWWYAMEFVDGPSLSLRLRQEGRLGVREALRLFIPLCEALEHLYEHGVVHRDIKPANILIDQSGRARLADLGLAFADNEPEITRQGGTLGTPHYISPEQAVDSKGADVRSDIWSFGATLFHVVCGRPPFRGGSAAEVLSGVLNDRVPDPLELEPSLPKGLAFVLRKCLAREPENRYQTPRELLLDLERVRERRAPKVSVRALDPVEGERPPLFGRLVKPLAIAGIGAAAVWFWAMPKDETVPRETEVSAETLHPALEAVAKRFATRPDSLASCLRELDSMESTLSERHRSRWESLRRELIGVLHARVFALEDVLEVELEAELQGRDIKAAWASLEAEFEPLFLSRTGFRPADLEAYGLSVGTWAAPLASRVVERTREATRELRARLAEWHADLQTQTAARLSQRQWKAAHAALQIDYPDIPAAAGFTGWKLPDEALEGDIFNARSELTMLRLNVEDDWRTVDRGLARWVAERADTLEGELNRRELRRGAAEELRDSFAVELEARRVSEEHALYSVARNAWDRLERRATQLEGLEERLHEVELRARLADVDRDAVFYSRLREYEFVEGLWEDLARALLNSGGVAEDGWRAEISRRIDLRRREIEILSSLLERVCVRLRALDGETINLWVGSILVREAHLSVPPDPLAEGFFIEGDSEPLSVRELRGTDVEKLAGFRDASALASDELLQLALFRFHDQRARDARRALLSGKLDTTDTLLRDLRNRVLGAIEEEENERRTVASQASELLRHTLAAGLDENAIEADLHRIRILLERYGDLDEVKKRRPELIALREKLIGARGASFEERLERSYHPTQISFPRPGRVRLHYSFESERVDPWKSEAWRFDGVGWTLFTPATEWNELLLQDGVALELKEPLDVDTGAFEFSLVIEEPSTGPPQCLLLSVSGFHIAFLGAALPGGDGNSRWAVGGGNLSNFVDGLKGGKGAIDSDLLRRGERHEIAFRGHRSSGRFELFLDGRRLEGAVLSRSQERDRRIVVRAWESIRILRAELEVRR